MGDFEQYYRKTRLPWAAREYGGRVGAVEKSHIEINSDHSILVKENSTSMPKVATGGMEQIGEFFTSYSGLGKIPLSSTNYG